MTFDCPCCLRKGEHNRWAIWFAEPIDGGAPLAQVPKGNNFRWSRTGTTFEDLTLSPSVNCYVEYPVAVPFHIAGIEQHWHGFISKGEVTW